MLCRGRQLVKGKRFDSWRSVGLAAQAVRIHQARGVDELVLLDIGATPEGRGPDLDLVRELSEVCFMPLAVGGGVRSAKDVKALLNAGADKVVIGTEMVHDPDTIRKLANLTGRQALVIAVDYKPIECLTGERYLGAHVECGKTPALIEGMPMSPVTLAVQAEKYGAGEILLTSIDREGTMEGYDLDLIRQVSQAVSIPVIAHGGCSGYEDMARAIEAGASAVAAGALFQFTDCTPQVAAQYLASRGFEVRIHETC